MKGNQRLRAVYGQVQPQASELPDFIQCTLRWFRANTENFVGGGNLAQVVECLSIKHEALSSDPSTVEERKEERERRREEGGREGKKKEEICICKSLLRV
jgi:hypothetical protein